MTVLAFPPIVPDAVYRIRTINRSPPLYFEWQSDNEVRPTELKPNSETQKWSVVGQQDDTYTITNVASKVQLSVNEYSEGGEKKYRLYSGGVQRWHLDVRGDDFAIAPADNSKCIDIADNNWLILWERRNAPNQRFVLDSVEPLVANAGNPGGVGKAVSSTTPQNPQSGTSAGFSTTSTAIQAGNWNIKNRVTNGQLAISEGWPFPESPVRGWDAGAGSTSRYERPRVWTLTRSGEGYTFTNAQGPGLVPRYLNNGPVVNSLQCVCRLIPVPGTQYFYIAVGTDDQARVLHDPNNRPYYNGVIHMSEFNKDETRQHWVFYPPA
jgi:hypothetical protein